MTIHVHTNTALALKPAFIKIMDHIQPHRKMLVVDRNQAFLDACKSEDQSAAQVIREFMKEYVQKTHSLKQADLFIAEPSSKYTKKAK